MLQAVTRRWRSAFAAACVLAVCSACHAGDVVLLPGNSPRDAELQQIAQVAEFYGLALHSLQVKSSSDAQAALASLKSPQTLAVMVSQEALPGLDRDAVLAALRRPGRASVPLLVFGIVPGGDASLLTRWSGGAVESCGSLARNFRPDVLDVADWQFAGALAAVSLPAVASPACGLSLKSGAQNLTLLTARGKDAAVTTLARAEGNAVNVFFTPQAETFDSSWIRKPRGLVKAFSSLAPYFLFLHAAAGDYGWHQPRHYANFTIDDPWLTEPYGQLNYAALLAEMEKHKFHTTIAFVPWNFDRSRPDVVQLLRDHREQYSISIHGNDHAHREFGDYEDHSLEAQKADIRQAVARMERFRTLTGIPYDRFMIFPHFVAPKDTFAALGQYDFLGTANSIHVPDGEAFPADSAFLLRPFTLNYGGLLSFFRYSVEGEVPRLEIAIHSFLGNPLLFYGHQQFFDQGIGAFNRVADLVNRTQQDIRWAGMGEISRHTYLIRRRADDQFDVRMMSNEMELTNPAQRTAVFHVQREDGPIGAVTLDGREVAFERSAGGWSLELEIPAGGTRVIRTVHANDLDLTREDPARTSTYVTLLRHVSDFRDMSLSRSSAGRFITRVYYQQGWDSYQLVLEKAWWGVAAGLVIVVAGFLYVRRSARKTRVRQVPAP